MTGWAFTGVALLRVAAPVFLAPRHWPKRMWDRCACAAWTCPDCLREQNGGRFLCIGCGADFGTYRTLNTWDPA